MASYCGWVLYSDIVAADNSGGNRVGDISSTIAKVSKRRSASYLWRLVRGGDAVFEGDTVRTGVNSAAVIGLADGKSIELSENSLVVIEDPSKVALQFLSGQFVVRGPDGDKSFAVSGGEQSKQTALSYRLKSPQPFAIFPFVEGEASTVAFEAEPLGMEANNAYVEVARDSQFTTRLQSLPYTPGQTALSLRPGKFYWRIRDGKGLLSESRSFLVNRLILPSLISPRMNSTIRSGSPEATIRFRWALGGTLERQTGQHYLVITGEKGEPKRVAISLEDGHREVDALPAGPYSWRIESSFFDRTFTSEEGKFQISHDPTLPVELVRPASTLIVRTDQEFPVEWNWNGEVSGYRLVAMDAKENRTTFETALTSQIVKLGAVGTYQIWIEALQKDRILASSGMRTVVVSDTSSLALISPTPKQQIFFWEEVPTVKMKWQAEDKSRNIMEFEIQIATNDQFSNMIFSKRVSEPECAISGLGQFAPGIFYWRVIGRDQSGAIVDTSIASVFQFGLHPILPSPATAAPLAGAAFKVLRAGDEAMFEWQAVDNAVAYEFTLSQAGKIALAKIVTEPRYVLSPPLEGQYEWSVRAIDPVKRRGLALENRPVSLELAKRLSAPVKVGSKVE